MTKSDKYEKAKKSRESYTDAILASKSAKKIVVAGPGTGKTHLFEKILQGKKKTLTLTFVNTLIEDLSLELYGLSEVKTLHGFARGRLSKSKIYPKLDKIIQQDGEIIAKRKIDFEAILRNRENKPDELNLYSERRKYYNPYFGYLDIIYNVVLIFETDKSKIPKYDLVLVDEFQDFNLLEVSLIDLLTEKSPILIAGDDDQALYGFKDANSDHLRDRHSQGEFEVFTLPYCSRSTKVIVDSVNDLISAGQKAGHLKGRINKSYKYFDDEEKDRESSNYPYIAYKHIFATQIPWFIDTQINEIAKAVRKKFTVLVATPTKMQARAVAKNLTDKGFENVEFVDHDGDKEPNMKDALRVLLEDKKSNLGWRIVAQSRLSKKDFKNLINDTHKNPAKTVYSMVDTNIKKEIEDILDKLRGFAKDTSSIGETDLDNIVKQLGIEPAQLKREAIEKKMGFGRVSVNKKPAKKIPIKVTTVTSSKGLSADYVFLTHFDDQFYIRGPKIADSDICNLLVGLTRARRKVYLISCNSQKKKCSFISWIDKTRVQII